MAGYGSDGGFDVWLAENGYTAPVTPTKAVLRQRGSAYVDGLYGPRFPGAPTGGIAQERAWPRTGATAYGADIASNAIPDAMVKASYFAAYQEGLKPGRLAVSAAGGAVKRKKVEGLEVEYFDGAKAGAAGVTPTFSYIDGLLGPLLAPTVGEPSIMLV